MSESNLPTSVVSKPRRFGAVLQHVPTVIVLGALGGLAWWGHHTGWTMPRFSELAGGQTPVAKE